MWHWGYDGWWMWLTMTAFWAALIGFGIWWTRAVRIRDQGASHRRAIEVLEVRYASGEIDDDEFRHRRSILKQDR
jgi:putative membrane protein